MKVKLHHVNLCSTKVEAMDTFYRDVLDYERHPGRQGNRVQSQDGYNGAVAFVTDGNIEFHLSEKDLGVGFRTGQAVNPLEKGHIAFRTDDIAAFKKRLEEKKIPYSNYGAWAMGGWDQIFFYDPDGNIIEVHQVKEGAAD
jgi:catechol 2,3-dioxygenase-like lactoylglutathione lyase family enzyme